MCGKELPNPGNIVFIPGPCQGAGLLQSWRGDNISDTLRKFRNYEI